VRPYSEEDRAKVDEQLRAFYDQFVEKVAVSRRKKRRKSTPWRRSGLDRAAGEGLGLVDALGGLDKAVAIAKERAKIPPANRWSWWSTRPGGTSTIC